MAALRRVGLSVLTTFVCLAIPVDVVAQAPPQPTPAERVSVPNTTFDPLLAPGGDPSGDPAFDAAAGAEIPSDLDEDYFLIQRESVIDDEWLDLLESVGCTILETHGDRVVLARMADGTSGLLDLMAETPRWWGPYKPQFKPLWDVEPALRGEDLTNGMWPDGSVVIVGGLHAGEDALAYEAVLDLILQSTCGDYDVLPSIVADSGASSLLAGQLRVQTTSCAKGVVQALAQLEAVQVVELLLLPASMADDSTWYTQTGIPPGDVIPPDASTWQFDTVAKLFAHAVNGRGQIVVALDRGLAPGECHLVYGPNPDDVTPSIEVAPPAALPGTSEYLRPSNKIIARYVLDYPVGTRSHGTAATCMAAGDHFWATAARAGVRIDDPVDDEDVGTSEQEYALLLDHVQHLDGAAPGAQVIEQASFLGLSLSELTREQAYMTHPMARIHTSSIDSGNYDYGLNQVGLDRHAWRRRDSVLISAAANFGPGAATADAAGAQAKNVIAVGATLKGWTAGAPAASLWEDSSHGPGFRDILKPDLVAPGGGLTLVDAVETDDPTCGGEAFDSGTSFSAPTVAGIATDLRQYFMDGYYPSGSPEPSASFVPTNALIRAVLINSTRNLTGAFTADCATETGGESADRPSFGQGWGRLVIDDSLYLAGDPTHPEERSNLLVLTDTPNGLTSITDMRGDRSTLLPDFHAAVTTGAVHEYDIHVEAGEPLHVTLAWTDPPGPFGSAAPSADACPRELLAPGGANPLVNDLDLEIVDPDGKVWRTRPGSTGGATDVPQMTTDPMRLWSGGYSRLNPGAPVACPSGCGGTCPGTGSEEDFEQSEPPTCDFATRDSSNTIENVFIEVPETGWYRARVIGYRVLGNRVEAYEATPDWILDTGVGVDMITEDKQGYALVASGKVSTNHAALSFTQAYVRCDDTATVFVREADATGGTVRITTSQGDCDFDLAAVSGVFQASFRIADVDDGATACGTTLDPLVIAGDDETITATFIEDATRVVRATTRVSCRNLSLVSVEVLEGCDATVADGALNPDEYAILEVTIENATDRPIDELFGRVTSLWDDVEILGNPGVGTLAGPTSTMAVLQVPVLVHLGGPCTVGSELRRFILEFEGEHGFRDRVYFNVPMSCTPGAGVDAYRPGEVPSMDGAGGVLAMRVTKAGADHADLEFKWTADMVGTHYNIWTGSVASLQGGHYDHSIAAGSQLCDVAEQPALINSITIDDGAVYFGFPAIYYLINAESPCGAWLDLAGSMGDGDRDGDPSTASADDQIPGGILHEAGCLP